MSLSLLRSAINCRIESIENKRPDVKSGRFCFFSGDALIGRRLFSISAHIVSDAVLEIFDSSLRTFFGLLSSFELSGDIGRSDRLIGAERGIVGGR